MMVAPQPSRKTLGKYDIQEEGLQAGSGSVGDDNQCGIMQRMTLPGGALESHTAEDDATNVDGSLEAYLVEMYPAGICVRA